jgi:pentatricopeptide repeat protein
MVHHNCLQMIAIVLVWCMHSVDIDTFKKHWEYLNSTWQWSNPQHCDMHHSCWRLWKTGMIGETLPTVAKVWQFGIVPNLCMYKVYHQWLVQGQHIRWCVDLFCRHDKNGISSWYCHLQNIIDGFVKTLKLQEAFRFYHKMLDEGTNPNMHTYTSLINDLCHDNRLPEAVTLFTHIIEEGQHQTGFCNITYCFLL